MKFLILFLLSFSLYAQRVVQADLIVGQFNQTNYVKNPEATYGNTSITDANNILTINTTNPLNGLEDFLVTPVTPPKTITFSVRQFDNSLANQPCVTSFTYKGDASAYVFRTSVAGSDLTFDYGEDASLYPKTVVSKFTCPQTATTTVFTMDAAYPSPEPIQIDSIFVGADSGFGSGGSATFQGLTDVSLTATTTGDYPRFNSVSGKWENKPFPALNFDPLGTATSAVSVHNATSTAHSALFATKMSYESAGCYTIPTLVYNGNGNVTIAGCDVTLYDNATYQGMLKYYPLTPLTATLTDLVTNYVVADYNSGTPIFKVITDVELINESNVVPVFTIFRNGIYIHHVDWDSLGKGMSNKLHQSIVKTQRYRLESGLALGDKATRYVTVTSGRVWVGAVRIFLDAADSSSATTTFFTYYHVTGNWTQAVGTQYNNLYYDTGTTTTTLTNGRYAVNWIYRGVENQDHIYNVWGGGDYTLSQAQASQPPVGLPQNITSHAILIGRIIIQKSASVATQVDSAFAVALTPSALAIEHNDTANIQDAQNPVAGEHYHMNQAQSAIATQAASSSVSGYVNNAAQNFSGIKTFTNGIVSSASVTAASFANNDKDNFIADGSFELGISAFTCSVGTCTATNTVAQGSGALKIVTANQTASVTYSACNTAYAYRDLGVTIEMKSDLATARLCGFTPAGNQNCALVPSLNAWNRVPTYVTADANGCYGMNISTSGTSTGTIFADMASISTSPWVYKQMMDYQTGRYNTWAGYGNPATKIPYFTNSIAQTGNQANIVTVKNDSTNGFSLTASKDCSIRINMAFNAAVASQAWSGFSLNSTQLSTTLNGITQADIVTAVSPNNVATQATISQSSAVVRMKAGDILRPHTDGQSPDTSIRVWLTFEAQAESESVVTPIKQNLEEWNLSTLSSDLTDRTNEIQFGTTTVTKNGAVSTLASIVSNSSGLLYANTGSDPTKFFCTKPCKLIISFNGPVVDASRSVGIYKNGAVVQQGNEVPLSTQSFVSTEVTLNGTTDWITVGTIGSSLRNTADVARLSILAIASDAQALGTLPIPKTAFLRDVKTSGTAGGAFTGGVGFLTRTLNTVDGDTQIVSLDTGTSSFTLPAGEYFIDARAPVHEVDYHLARIFNHTDQITAIWGTSEINYYTADVSNASIIKGKITITSPKVFSLQHSCTRTRASDGFGLPSGLGQETYSIIQITKYK